MQSRPTRRLAKNLKKAARKMSERKVAILFNITTPEGKPNSGMVHKIMHGYQPAKRDTLKRCGLLKRQRKIIHDEPARRVLTGAWKLGKRWVSPEEFCGVRS
jgi:hypothetical protein